MHLGKILTPLACMCVWLCQNAKRYPLETQEPNLGCRLTIGTQTLGNFIFIVHLSHPHPLPPLGGIGFFLLFFQWICRDCLKAKLWLCNKMLGFSLPILLTVIPFVGMRCFLDKRGIKG